MSLFIHRQFVEYSFPTSLGLVDAGAEVSISGSTLVLIEPVVYSGDGTRIYPGVRTMLEIARQVEQLAKLQGFTHLLLTGHRNSGATPGRPVQIERRIR